MIFLSFFECIAKQASTDWKNIINFFHFYVLFFAASVHPGGGHSLVSHCIQGAGQGEKLQDGRLHQFCLGGKSWGWR